MQFHMAVLAIPVFLALIVLEQVIERAQQRRGLSLEELVSNLGCGIFQQFVQMPIRVVSFAAYVWVYTHLRLVSIPSAPWAWFLCFLTADLMAYWYHRLSHQVAAFWASHEVHHQSEGLDLTVSLRVPALDYYFWVFDLPLALLGFPPAMFLFASALVSIYGFSSHTRMVGTLGPLEGLLVTPSHHRLHHARNPEYLDRNYGKVLILWDRLFGTFVAEGAAPIYGTPIPLKSSNPIWANLRPVVELIRKVRRTRSLTNRLRVLLMPPAWRPADSGRQDPMAEAGALHTGSKTGGGKNPRPYVLGHFLAALLVTIALLNFRSQLPTATLAFCASLLIATIAILGGLLDGRPWARRAEILRVGVLGGLVLLL